MTITIDLTPTIQEIDVSLTTTAQDIDVALTTTTQDILVDLTPVTQAIAVNLTTTTQTIEITLGVVESGLSQVEVKNEIPTGAIDGSNAIFTTAFPFVPESIQLFLNGIRQKSGDDFVNTDNQTILFSLSPDLNSFLLIDYTRSV